MTVPTPKNEHGILIDNSCMPKPLQRLDTFTINFLPFIYFIFDATFMQVTIPSLSIITSINK